MSMSMATPGTPRLIEEIRGYHAHVYYEPDTRPQAARLRAWIAERFAVRIGRWHDAPVGPHTRAMYLVVFEPAAFATIVPWLALNHAGLSVLIHPETGDDLADHTEHALWLGPRLPIDENALR
jgi:aromatic ring-cleaving dioxygenase